MANLSQQTATTTFWATLEKFGVLFIQFVVSIILARLLSPSDYGVIAIIMVFINIAQQFVECGFGNALIRKLDCSQNDYSTAFWFNVAISVIFYVALSLAAPIIARFYNMDVLKPVLRVLGLGLIVNAFSMIQNVLLTKQLAFKDMAKCNIMSAMFSGGLGLICAYKGLEVWALVIQMITNGFLMMTFMSMCTKWRPTLIWSKDSFKYLWNFGSKLLASGILSSLYSNLYSLLIGKYYDKNTLGLFNRGQSTSLLVPNILSSVFSKSTLPLLSNAQNDEQSLYDTYRKFTKLVSFVSFPLIFLTIALAEPFVMVVLTEKWIGSIIYLQIFAASALTATVGMVNLNLIIALGRSDIMLKADIYKKILGIIVIIVLVHFGTIVLAIGSTILNIVFYLLNMYYARQLIDISFKTQLRDMLPTFCASSAMAAFVMMLNSYISNSLVELIVGTLVGLLFYGVITRYFLRVTYYDILFKMILKNGKSNHN